MLVLGIETATPQVGVAIGGHEGVIASFHSRSLELHPCVRCLEHLPDVHIHKLVRLLRPFRVGSSLCLFELIVELFARDGTERIPFQLFLWFPFFVQ